MHRVKVLVAAIVMSLLGSLLASAPPVAGQAEPPGSEPATDARAEPLDPGDPTAPAAPDPSTELVEERTPASRTYVGEDGTYTTMLTTGPPGHPGTPSVLAWKP